MLCQKDALKATEVRELCHFEVAVGLLAVFAQRRESALFFLMQQQNGSPFFIVTVSGWILLRRWVELTPALSWSPALTPGPLQLHSHAWPISVLSPILAICL